jgi:HEPN domain-containing protein
MKSPEDVAALFLNKARQDLKAAGRLSGDDDISDEIVGFHIQQAIEKGLKALLAAHVVDFRKTHDIRELMDLVAEKLGALPEQFADLDEWTSFGVELRYDDIPARSLIHQDAATGTWMTIQPAMNRRRNMEMATIGGSGTER